MDASTRLIHLAQFPSQLDALLEREAALLRTPPPGLPDDAAEEELLDCSALKPVPTVERVQRVIDACFALEMSQARAEEEMKRIRRDVEENPPVRWINAAKGVVWRFKGETLRRLYTRFTGEINTLTDEAITESLAGLEHDPVAADETRISIALYHPQRTMRTHQIEVVGSTLLSALRDAIPCTRDDWAETVLKTTSRGSGFLFFENVFFNDMRAEGAIDYSETIINWANADGRSAQPGLGVYTARDMAGVRFSDLMLRVGVPYLYTHFGDCEHIMVITDVRRIHASDPQNRNAYPLISYAARTRMRKCSICNLYFAKYCTFGDRLAPEVPCFFCSACYQPFHYAADGEPLYEYKVYPSFHE